MDNKRWTRSSAQLKLHKSKRSEFKESRELTTRVDGASSSEQVLSPPDSKDVERSEYKEAPITSTSSSEHLSPESKNVQSDKGEDQEQISPDNGSSSGESENEMEKGLIQSEEREAGRLGGEKRGPGGLGKDEREPADRETEQEENKELQLMNRRTDPTIITMYIYKFLYSTHPLEFLFCFLLALIIKLKIYPPKDELDWLLFIIFSMITIYAIGFNVILILLRWIKHTHVLFRLTFMIAAMLFVSEFSNYVDTTNSPVRYIYNPYMAAYHLAPFFSK